MMKFKPINEGCCIDNQLTDMSSIISILSSGYGRLHLAQSADWLGKTGVNVKLVCGWVPKNPDGWLVRLCSKLVGRNLSAGMRKRSITLENGGSVLSCAWVDFLCNAMFVLEGKLFHGRFHGEAAALAWKIFGWQSKRHIRKFRENGNVVFHVRSGAGHGGAIEFAKKLGIPVVVDHSIAHPAYMEKHLRPEYEKYGAIFDLGTSSPFWRLVAEDCEWADVLLVNSFFVRDTFIEQGYPADKIKVAYLGTRPDFFELRKRQAAEDGIFRLLFTGGFGFRKGAEYILEALKILKEKAKYPFTMDVVGDYGSAKEIIAKYEQYNLPITFHGPIPQDDLKQYLSKSDIYVFPSLAEGCACSGMEAMGAGLCVVATHEAGFPIEDGINGCNVPGKNAEAVANRILKLMASPAEIDRMGKAAAELIRTKYTWEQYAANVKNIYEELLGYK